VIERACGLDVHKKTVVACVRVPGRTSAREQHVRTFGTTTAELLALRNAWGSRYASCLLRSQYVAPASRIGRTGAQ